MEVPNQQKIETKWQKYWQENKVFEPKIDKKKEPFFMTVPYPYANSTLHIGHGRTFTMADIVGRYQRLLGKNVLYPMAYHVSGTPVLAVSDAISRGDAKEIQKVRDAISDFVVDKKEQDKLIESFKEPLNIAKFFSSKIEETFNSVGLAIDYTRAFTTGDKVYQKFIEWQYTKLYDAGILIKGKYPILYSVDDENAVGEDDIKDGDTDKVSIQEMNYILFKLTEKDEYLVPTTLRPDAIFGATNMWLNENSTLIRICVNDKIWIVSDKTKHKIISQFSNTKVLGKIDAKSLIGKKVIVPITSREIIIAKADFIDETHGTGVVYSSPAGAPHDYISLIEAKKEGRLPKDLGVINSVETTDKKGTKIVYDGSCPAEAKCKKFGVSNSSDLDKLELAKQELYKEEHYGGKLTSIAGKFAGLPISKAKEVIAEELSKLKLGGVFYETSRKAITRGGSQVIVAVLEGQWFLDYSKPETKEKAYHLLDKMQYFPNSLKASQKGYLEWVKMRPCARKRGLGTPLPYDKNWVIESLSDSTIYQMFYLVSSYIGRFGITPEQLTYEFFEYVLLGHGELAKLSKSIKVNDKFLLEIRESVEYWKRVNFRYTAPPHMSNHLSFLIYHYALIFPEKQWPTNITVGGLMIRDGQKISKSKGNGLPLIQVKDTFGVDLFRLYVAVSASYEVEMDFKDSEILALEKKFNKLKEMLYESRIVKLPLYDEFEELDKWLISRFYSRSKSYFKSMDEMKIREAYVTMIYEFLTEVAYHERRTSHTQTLSVLRFILQDFLQILTPVIPHFCEELNLDTKAPISLQKFDKAFGEKYIKSNIENKEAILQNLISSITMMKETKNIAKLSKLTLAQATDLKFELFDELKNLLEQTRDFKTIFAELNKSKKFESEQKFIQKFVPKTLGEGLSYYLPKSQERKLFESLSEFLKEEFGVKPTIVDISELKDANSNNALPTKPSIILE